MWIDDKGVLHTVALPRPKTRLDRRYRKYLKTHRRDINPEFMERLQEATADELVANAASFDRESLEGAPFPADLEIGANVALAGASGEVAVERAVAALPLQWRLDALNILEDLLDDWD